MNVDPIGLASAWYDRAQRAAAILADARKAPALFRPTYVAEVEADLEAALRWHAYWLSVGAA